ncbi:MULTISPECIES: winged helix-turn-helix domain-containing protein [unclassified Microbacterium]|uniref:winged helix-turn-helix domain-containing protein n=1 Tax=unclassified Microbacterium TaxID=2609290 RepID=UPI00214BD297|nr:MULTISPECIES: helix-turn-helix domain-containing protein [unclassified Microbacterium]MCR2799965.1 helix-turn-helix domain-containing protein [Microbacterium sp. zg.Y818]MCR2827747.1 helix-turn-helix domain-containing protein [Microbacterium sp. zg.Y909]WIM21943.1 helix-turn-helix domain-containing protein [Microbacterium sp. zg-Y818]
MVDDGGTARGAVMTSAMLKAMSHPLRRRIMKVLAARDYARAADIAADLDEPANSVSFHLRSLADAGLVVEAPEQARDRRDRVWTAVKGSFDLGSPDHPVEDEALGGTLLAALAQEHTDMLRRVVGWAPEYTAGRSAGVHGTFARTMLRLSEQEFVDLLERISTAIEQAREAHDTTAADARVWELDIIAADDTI